MATKGYFNTAGGKNVLFEKNTNNVNAWYCKAPFRMCTVTYQNVTEGDPQVQT